MPVLYRYHKTHAPQGCIIFFRRLCAPVVSTPYNSCPRDTLPKVSCPARVEGVEGVEGVVTSSRGITTRLINFKRLACSVGLFESRASFSYLPAFAYQLFGFLLLILFQSRQGISSADRNVKRQMALWEKDYCNGPYPDSWKNVNSMHTFLSTLFANLLTIVFHFSEQAEIQSTALLRARNPIRKHARGAVVEFFVAIHTVLQNVFV